MRNNLDTLIKEVLEEEFDNIVYPPLDEEWNKMLLKIHHFRKQVNFRYFIVGLAVGILISLISFI